MTTVCSIAAILNPNMKFYFLIFLLKSNTTEQNGQILGLEIELKVGKTQQSAVRTLCEFSATTKSCLFNIFYSCSEQTWLKG